MNNLVSYFSRKISFDNILKIFYALILSSIQYNFKMKKLFLFGLLLVTLVCQSQFAIVTQQTLLITSLDFQVKLECRDDIGIGKDCQFVVAGLPTWLSLQNNVLKAISPPPQDSEETIVIVATDSQGRQVSQSLKLVIKYYETLQAQSSEQTTTESISTEGNQITRETSTQTVTVTNTDAGTEVVTETQESTTTTSQEDFSLTYEDVVGRTGDYTYLQLLSRQQEAHELILSYLNLLEEETSKNSQTNVNIETLQIQLQNVIREESSLMDQIQENQGQLFQFERQLLKLVDELKQVQVGLSRQRVVVSDQEESLENKERLRATLQNNLRNINSEIEKREQEIRILQTSYSGQSQKCGVIQGQIDEANKVLDSLVIRKRSQENNVALLQRESNDYSRRIQDLLNQVAVLEGEKSQVDQRKRQAQISLTSIEIRISDYEEKIKILTRECVLESVNEIESRIALLRSEIVSFQEGAENIRRQIATLQLDILKEREILEIAKTNLSSIESLLEEIIVNNETLQQNIQITNQKLSSLTSRKALIELEKNRLQVQISSTQGPTINLAVVRELEEKLEDVMIERIIIDSLIKRILETQDNVLLVLGFNQLYQNYIGLPENSAFSDIAEIQRVLKNEAKIFKINLFSDFNLQESCSKSSLFYNIGRVIQVGSNEVRVQTSEGDLIRVKIPFCSYNLSPNENFQIKVGDTLTWRAYQEDNLHIAVQTVSLSI